MSEKERVISFDSVFLNSESIFIEYVDIIRATYYPLLNLMRKHEEHPLYDLSKINNLSVEEFGDWYISRKHQNPLLDLFPDDNMNHPGSVLMDSILDEQISKVPQLLKMAPILNGGKVLKNLFKDGNQLVEGGFYIWYPTMNKSVINDINTTFESIMKYGHILTGPIDEALTHVPNDSTYIFSDITNINVMHDIGKLAYSSIIIPVEYGYNANDGKYIIDFDMLRKEVVFKLDEFYATED